MDKIRYRKYTPAPINVTIPLKEIYNDFKNEEKLLNPDSKFLHIIKPNGEEMTQREYYDYTGGTSVYKKEDLSFKDTPNVSANEFARKLNSNVLKERKKPEKLKAIISDGIKEIEYEINRIEEMQKYINESVEQLNYIYEIYKRVA